MEYQHCLDIDSANHKGRSRPKVLLVTSVSLALALLSCSLIGDGDSVGSTGDSVKDPVPSPTPVPATQAAGASESNLPCQSPQPREVAFGESFAEVIEDDNDRDCYWVQVPADLESVTFKVAV